MITLNEMNAIEVCDEDVSPVGITPILKREYQEKIKAKTKVGYNRAKRKEGGVGEAITLVESYWQISGEVMEDKMHTMVSLIANEKGHLLADRETIYWLHEKSPYVAGKSFNAGEVMEHMMDIGIIKEMSKSYHTKGLAREARIREKKGLYAVLDNL